MQFNYESEGTETETERERKRERKVTTQIADAAISASKRSAEQLAFPIHRGNNPAEKTTDN